VNQFQVTSLLWLWNLKTTNYIHYLYRSSFRSKRQTFDYWLLLVTWSTVSNHQLLVI